MKKLVVIALVLPLLAACRVTGVGVHAQIGTPPPPHHDYYSYYYYPDVEVYFDISRNVYFYYSGGRWVMSARLPRHIHIDIDDHVTIELESDRPYRFHDRYRKEYPRGKWKKHYRNGPPDHAPAHGYRSRFRNYHYYPDADVYYDPRRKIYYYPSGRRWVETRRLPSRYRIRRDDYVEFDDDSDRPYEQHQRHQREYPRGDWKQRYREMKERRKEQREERYENRQQYREQRHERREDRQKRYDDRQQRRQERNENRRERYDDRQQHPDQDEKNDEQESSAEERYQRYKKKDFKKQDRD